MPSQRKTNEGGVYEGVYTMQAYTWTPALKLDLSDVEPSPDAVFAPATYIPIAIMEKRLVALLENSIPTARERQALMAYFRKMTDANKLDFFKLLQRKFSL